MLWHAETQLKSLTLIITSYLYHSFVLCGPANSQIDVHNLKFERFAEEEGLSSRFTTCMLQDRFGFLWFGTQYDLNRYDGYEVSIFSPRLQDSTAMAGKWVTRIFEDRKGGLWISTRAALNRFNRATETLTAFRPEPQDPSHPGNSIRDLLEDRSGLFWVGTDGGYYSFDPTTGTFSRQTPEDARPTHSAGARPVYEDRVGTVWLSAVNPGNPKLGGLYRFEPDTSTLNPSHNRPRTHYNHDPGDSSSLNHNSVVSILEDTSGTLWFATYFRGLNMMVDRDAGRFESFTAGPGGSGLPGDALRFLHEDRSGTVWTGGRDGLARYNRTDNTWTSYSFDNKSPGDGTNNVSTLFYEDREGNLWMWGGDGPPRGLLIFQPKAEKFIRYRHEDAEGLRQLMDIQEDDAGSVWIVTGNEGIQKVDQAAKPFTSFRHDPANPESLSDSRITRVYEDRSGTLWAGTFANGLNKLVSRSSNSKDTFKHYTHDPENPNSLSNTWVRSIYEDQAGVLWIGTGVGLDRFNPQTETFTHFHGARQDYRSLSPGPVTAIYEDREGNFWVGTRGGLNTLDRANGIVVRYLHHLEASLTSGGGGILTIYEDRSGTLWFGLDGEGLRKYNRGQGTFTSYLHDPRNPNSLSSGHVGAIAEDTTDNLWIATGLGLNRFDRQTGSFTRFGQEIGFASNQIGGLILEQGLLWFGNKGISTFDPVQKAYRNYGFGGSVEAKGQDGALYSTDRADIYKFYPNQIRLNPYVPPVVLTKFFKFEQRVYLNEAIEATEEIVLSHNENFFGFEYVALNYSNSEKNQYKYQLEGVDEDWIDAGTRRYASYTNVAPGSYTFRVIGSNNDGICNEEGTSIKITITPPWWETWWAYSLYVLMFGGAVFGYIRYKTQAQEKELAFKQKQLEQEQEVSDQLRRVDRLKDDFLANTSHELRTPLQGIIGLTESLKDRFSSDPPERTHANMNMIIASGKRLAILVNDILDFAKLKKQDLQLQRKPVDIRVLTDVVLKFSEPLIAGKKLVLKNEIPKEIPPVDGDENRLQQIMHNLVGNAIKFTESGSVKVSAVENNGMVEISISDTGIGIPDDKQEAIFQSFEQVDASTAREYGGTGLGLAVTKQLVELHGGSIRVESEIGKGSTFKFVIPVSEGPVLSGVEGPESTAVDSDLAQVREIETTEAAVTQIEIDGRDGDIHVLVVDDEPVNQQVLANHLSFVNYNVTQAFNGEEALKAIESGEKFDLVLLDIMMPKMSGYEVCQKIRETYLPGELPVIMVTAKNQVTDLVEGFSSGANDYLAKPFTKDELLMRMKTQLNLSKINTAYGRFVPHEFLRFLGKESIIDVKLGDNVEKEMTIFVSDIRSFTTLSEKMTPEENFAFINDYLAKASPIIREHGGFVDRYSGDAIMALFPNEAEDALQAAIATLKLVVAEAVGVPDSEPLHVGIGLHTGSLMLGIVGEQARAQGDIFSDAVNLANRIEGLSKLYGVSIVVSEQTLSRLPDSSQYHQRFLGKVQVKGKKDSVSVFEIYDGDPDDLVELKLQTKDDFEQGLHLYFDKKFAEAATPFNKVLELNPNDKTAKLYLERSAQFMVQGVPEDWEGVEAMENK